MKQPTKQTSANCHSTSDSPSCAVESILVGREKKFLYCWTSNQSTPAHHAPVAQRLKIDSPPDQSSLLKRSSFEHCRSNPTIIDGDARSAKWASGSRHVCGQVLARNHGADFFHQTPDTESENVASHTGIENYRINANAEY